MGLALSYGLTLVRGFQYTAMMTAEAESLVMYSQLSSKDRYHRKLK